MNQKINRVSELLGNIDYLDTELPKLNESKDRGVNRWARINFVNELSKIDMDEIKKDNIYNFTIPEMSGG